jgi:hypothetical protein
LFDGRVQAFKDGRSWQIGTAREVSWIASGTTGDLSITAAIPPAFEAYATCYEPDGVTIEAHACIRGSKILVEALRRDPGVHAHRVQRGVDPKPPGRDRDYGTATATQADSRMPLWYRDT